MQEDFLKIHKKTFTYRTEWPTFLLIFIIYTAWGATLLYWEKLGIVLSSIILVLVNSWFMSLQHELLHGHPTRYDALNRLFGIFPFALWYPYDLYKHQHLIHHKDEQLTDPILDTESNYIYLDTWKDLSSIKKFYYWSNRTLIGRIFFGPMYSIFHTIKHFLSSFINLRYNDILMWIQHIFLIGCLFSLLAYVFEFSILNYIILTYFSLSLALIRSFYEHRPAEKPEQRTVINEAELFFRILFLDNNYHLVHHDLPNLPWFYLKKIFVANKGDYIQRNRDFYYQGYLKILKKNHFIPIDSPIYQDSIDHLNIKLKVNSDNEQ